MGREGTDDPDLLTHPESQMIDRVHVYVHLITFYIYTVYVMGSQISLTMGSKAPEAVSALGSSI